MHQLHSSVGRLVLTMCAVLITTKVTRCSAELIAYEPFDYPAGSEVLGLSGGQGWTSPWTPRPGHPAPPLSSQMIVAGSLPGPLGLPTAGNHAKFVGQPTFTQADVRRSFPEVIGAAGTTVWVSFLGQRVGEQAPVFEPQPRQVVAAAATSIWPNNPYPRSGNLSFFDTQSMADPSRAERISVGNSTASSFGNPNHFDEWSLIPEGQPVYRRGPADHMPKQSELAWAVMRIDFFGDHTVDDDAWLWLNPDPRGGEPLTANADVAILRGHEKAHDYSGLDYVRPFAGNAEGSGLNYMPAAAILIDEIRIGTTWLDVNGGVPEPTSVKLLSAVVPAIMYGMTARRRRR
jgi:hypothetical protein